MDPVNNNQFEVVPTKSKRKVPTSCNNVYLNPALDLLANEDPMCNTAMEIVPNKKRKRTRSCDIVAFENSALDLGISKAAVNEFLAKELENVRKNVRPYSSTDVIQQTEPKMNLSEPTLNFSTLDIDYAKPMTEAVYANLSTAPVMPVLNVPVIPAPIYADVKPNNEDADMSIPPKLPPRNVPLQTNFDTCQDMSTADEEATLPTDDNTQAVGNSITNTNIAMNLISTDYSTVQNCIELSQIESPTDAEIDSGISELEHKSLNPTINEFGKSLDLSAINNTTHVQTNITNQVFVNSPNLSLSFIDRLALDSPNLSNQSLCLDDDLNESNIMEIKTITIITKKKRVIDKKKNTNPFLDPNFAINTNQPKPTENPFLVTDNSNTEQQYNDEVLNRLPEIQVPQTNNLMPRRLFTGDTINSTISTVNDSMNVEHHEYENVDSYRAESPIYENVCEEEPNYCNKQSKILGHDVSQFSAVDIMNLNKRCQSHVANSSNESNDSKKDLKHQILKASKLSKKVLKKLKKTFKGEKSDNNVTLNPYEIPRKIPKQKIKKNESGIENPALNLDNSDEIEIFEDNEDDDEEHQYETIKTLRNTRLNMNVTPLKERAIDNIDLSQNKSNTPGKKVRFDSTLNQEKVITGNSFDYGLQSPGFDSKIDKYHDELENCINERKFLEQNM